jgi:hypothetical protein
VDDLLGRFIGKGNVRVLDYPAVAEREEPYRHAGDALFPELKPLEFLLERKKILPNQIVPPGGLDGDRERDEVEPAPDGLVD